MSLLHGVCYDLRTDGEVPAVERTVRGPPINQENWREHEVPNALVDRSGGHHGRRVDGSGGGYFGCRRNVPLSDLRQVGGRLQERDRPRLELPIDRFRRRHQADTEQDRHIWRIGRTAQGCRSGKVWLGAIPDGYGRHRAGREPRRDQTRRARHRRPDAGQNLPR